jgi:hypothetical protein
MIGYININGGNVMKKTKILVMTATIILGITSTVFAKLPANSIVIGTNVYNVSYLSNTTNMANVNDQLINNLGNIYYVDYNGVTKDIFTNSTVSDSQIVSKVGSSLTYYPGNGTTQKIVSDANNNYLDPSSANTGMNAIVSVSFNQLTGGINLFSCGITQLTGVSNASYFKIGNGSITALTDSTTYMDQLASSTPILHLYSSDGITELANGSVNIVTGGNASGKLNLTVNLTYVGTATNADSSTQGNAAANIVNNGFATIDKNSQWIYYSNTGDGGKLYRKSVTGTSDFLISNNSAKYINVVGDWVYYSNYNDNGKIYKVRTDGTQEQKVSDDMAACINVVGDNIYYINHSDRDRIYVQNSQGKKMLLTDQVNYLSVTGNYLFYINVGDSNKLYSYNLQNYLKTKISDVNTKFINACSDYLVLYTGLDGVLYRSTNAQGQLAVPMTVTTNVPQKKGTTTNYTTMTDKPTTLCATDDNNIYYVSYVDGNKIYKLDTTGNGFKVVDDSADFINIVGNYLYYMKGGKVSVASKDGDGTQKGTAIAKPKLSSKVVTVEPIPMYTTSDITTFNFPEKISCIMSDGSIQDLVVSWNRTIPKPAKGVYTFKGTILGYGNSVSISVGLDSGTISSANVTVANNVGNQDTLKAIGLTAGDTLSVYNNSTDTKPVKTAVADVNGNVNITGLSLASSGGTLYVTVTKTGRLEGNKVPVQYPAEAPVGFAVNAAAQQVTGLKAGQSYKVYIQNENADGSIPLITAADATMTAGAADSSGNLTVSNIITKIDNSANAKQMLRVVASGGTVDSLPSSAVEISRAQMPSYVGIDLNLGRITGTTTGMVFTYDNPVTATSTWYPCTAGTTTISMTRSLQVGVKILANGPVLESKVATYGLFQVPVITGVTDGGTYIAKDANGNVVKDANGNQVFPTIGWTADNNDPNNTIIYRATLTKDGTTIGTNLASGAAVDSAILALDKNSINGSYILTVTGTKTVSGMGSATNSTSVKFTVNSAIPSPIIISMLETPGTKKWVDANTNNVIDSGELLNLTSSDPLTYYQATSTWTDTAGTSSSAVVQRIDYSSSLITDNSTGAANNLNDFSASGPWVNAAKVALVDGYTLQQDGYYKLVVTNKSTENGATNTTTKIFRIDTGHPAGTPTVTGVVDAGMYNSSVTPSIADVPGCVTVPKIMLNGYSIPYTGGALTLNGNYVLILDTTNQISGATSHKQIAFTMNTASNVSPVIVNASVTNNASGDDSVVIGNTTTEPIPYGSTIKVYSAAGSLIGTAVNNGVAGPVTVTVTGGFPASDTYAYVTRTDSGMLESNKVKVNVSLAASVKTVSPVALTEVAANDGSVSGTDTYGNTTSMVTVEIQNGTINTGIANADVTTTNLPAGLNYTVTRLDSTHLGITIIGNATNNNASNSLTGTNGVTFTIDSSKITPVTGGTVQNITTTPISINFKDAPVAAVTSSTTAGGDALVSAAEKTAGFNVVAQSNTANSTLYVVPAGTANTAAAIIAASLGSAAVTTANTDATIAISANNAKVIDGTSYVVYAIDSAGTVSASAATAFTADLTAPTVTTKLLPAGTFTATGAQTLVFSEELSSASKATVKTAVDNAYTHNGSATVSSAWGTGASANILTVTLGGTMDASGSNQVVSTAITNQTVTDLAGNTSSALVVQ